jgi:hypothetical protein
MGEVISLTLERDRRRPGEPVRVMRGRDERRGRSIGAVTDARVGEPLWREVVGGVLRQERRLQSRTLADVAGRAGMSVQHLSEVERGRKEASSEMLAAATGALDLSLAELTRRCAGALTGAGTPSGPVLLAA